MGTLLDSSVLVRAERSRAERSRAGSDFLSDLGLLADEEVGIAAITASEVLHGVHRADLAYRPSRAAFVEHLLRTLPVYPFDLDVARVHARLWADLAAAGQMIGGHDLQIAATALHLGWAVATHNGAEFRRVSGLVVRGGST